MLPIASSSLWKRRNDSKSSNTDRALCHKVGITLARKQPTGKPNTTSVELTNNSSPQQQLQIETLCQSNSCGSLEKPPLSKGYGVLPEGLPFAFIEPPQSAPPEITSTRFQWPSPKTPPSSAQFYERSKETTRNSSSCHKVAKPQGKIREKESFPSAGINDSQCLKSTGVDTVTKDVPTRKPPFHLPPLDPSVFENMSESSKPKGSRGKKKKRQQNQPTSVDSTADLCVEKRANSDESEIKMVDYTSTETEQWHKTDEEIDLCHQKSHPAKIKEMSPCSPLQCEELATADHCIEHGTENVDTTQQTLTKTQLIADGGINFKAPQPGNSSSCQIASSMKVLPSQEDTVQALSSNRSCERTRVPFRVQAAIVSGYAPIFGHSRRRNENVPDSQLRRSTASPGNRDPVGLEGQVALVKVVRRRSSQPDLRQFRQCQLRRVGVCRETENKASTNNRMKARVLMKKFGELNISG